MTNTYSLPNNSPGGGRGVFQSILRTIFLVAATIGGFFIFAASAAFALFLVIGLLILGFVVFGILWLRAKILGKPIYSSKKMWTFQTFNTPGAKTDPTNKANVKTDVKTGGPVLDAHKTPDGWSVDND
ncbi:MAG: hypothetical protein JKY25_13695 [Robiginitomaculum sp.]|nr:hypothetical protein [Robiginitomaculum sp.]